MITATILCDASPACRIGTRFGGFRDEFLRSCFLLLPFLPLFIILVAGLLGMPWHFVCVAGLELADLASHDWLIISAIMNLARVTARTETHCEVWHVFEDRHERLPIISENLLEFDFEVS